jgi:hypothetical protein
MQERGGVSTGGLLWKEHYPEATKGAQFIDQFNNSLLLKKESALLCSALTALCSALLCCVLL